MDEIEHASVKGGRDGRPDTILIVRKDTPAEAAVSAVRDLAVSQPRMNAIILTSLGLLVFAVGWLVWVTLDQGQALDNINQNVRNLLEGK